MAHKKFMCRFLNRVTGFYEKADVKNLETKEKAMGKTSWKEKEFLKQGKRVSEIQLKN